jgi:hypothetical protein
MSFQTIFDISQSISVNTRKMAGQQVSRSGQVRTLEYLTAQPWIFTVKPHGYLYFPHAREQLQTIDNLDRITPGTITFSSSALSWFCAYQGALTSAQASALTLASVPAANATTISVGNLPAIGGAITSATIVFKAGDVLQLGNFPYRVTTQVLRGSSATVSVTIHRPVIGTPSAGVLAAVGSSCTWSVVAEVCPTYTLIPMTDGAFVNWDSDFVFRENVQ